MSSGVFRRYPQPRPTRRFIASKTVSLTHYTLAADSGTFALTGIAANPEYGRRFSAEAATYALTGIAASLERGYKVVAATDAFVLTGTATSLERGYKVVAASAAFVLLGTDATLQYGSVTHYSMSAASGTYTLTGTDASLALGWTPTFLLRDNFTTAAAAPLTTPRTAEPGPGTLTIVDTNSKASIAAGKLTFATGGVGSGDPGAWGAQLTRAAGLAVVAVGRFSVSGIAIGWDTNQSGVIRDGIRLLATTAIMDSGSSLDIGALSAGTDYSVAIIQRGTGFFAVIKGGAFSNWTLAWVGNAESSNNYPVVEATGNTAVGTVDTLRALQLPAPYTTDFGLATQRLAGSVAAGTTFSHEANCVIEYVQTTLPSTDNCYVMFRWQNDSNSWFTQINPAGDIRLTEYVAGVGTVRGVVTTVVSAGHRIVIVADGTTIRVYSNNVLRITYSSASSFATMTSGKQFNLNNGVVSNIVSWPRQLSSAAAIYLDVAIGAYVLTANSGTFALTGSAAGGALGRKIQAAPGIYTLTGIDAALKVARLLLVDAGTYTLTGMEATLTWSAYVPPVTPAERTFIVAYEERTYSVSAEIRTFEIA